MTPEERTEMIKELQALLVKSKEQLQELHDSMFSEERHQLDYSSKQLLYSMTGNIDNFVNSVWTPGYVSVDDYRKITGKDFVGTTADGVTYPLASSSASASATDSSVASSSASAVASSSASSVASDVASTSESAVASEVSSEVSSAVSSASEATSDSAVSSRSDSASTVNSQSLQ